MGNKFFSLVTIIGSLFLWGCYPNGPTTTDDLDVVITHHNPNYDFVAMGTYAIPDKIVKITGNLQEGDLPEYLPTANSSSILSRIDANMEALGWTRVALSASPDVFLAPAAWETTTINYYYDYWYWWWGGYYPSYPYYPPSYSSSYITGTLLLTIMDPDELDGNDYPIQQWTGVLNGILNEKFDAARINKLIDQAFSQSPYLKTN
ncbi:MAG: DUF4136 domain-containing protein [Bacteroidales bacterium]|nr:DUF4136 domain-containing protein [Bacteroidales bacterium]